MGTLIIPADTTNQATHHLRLCHTQDGLELDKNTPTNSFRLTNKSYVGQFWPDGSLLIGEQKSTGIQWHGSSFILDSPFLPIYRQRSRNDTRSLHITTTPSAFVPEGPADLARAWNTNLKEALKLWGDHLIPLQPCHAFSTGKTISPYHPFDPISEKDRQDLHTFLYTALLTLSPKGTGTITLKGKQPSTKGWISERLESKNLSYDHSIDTINQWVHTLFNHPACPIQTHVLIQDIYDRAPLLSFPLSTSSAHDIFKAHAYLSQFPDLPKI